MPGHWLYRYFPETWAWVKQHSLTPSSLHKALQQQGFETKLVQRTYYQAVRGEVALEMAQQREASIILSTLSDDIYQIGLERLTAECEGKEIQLASHFCIAEIVARRPA
jgi:hypothetical protein